MTAKTAAEAHREWLELVDTDGPFLSVPALKRVWPQGMPAPDSDALARLKEAKPAFEKAWEEWDRDRDDAAALQHYREARDEWVELVLRDVIGWGESYTTDLSGLGPVAAGVRSPDHTVTVTPTGALVHDGAVGALVLVVDPVDSLRDPVDDGWAASPIDRVEELCRAAGVAIGVVTDGRWWGLVSAREQTMVASGIVDAHTWIEEPQTRDAFLELLGRKRLLGGRPEDRLPALFKESVAAAEEITEALGVQVRRAVELLVQALSEAGLNAVRAGEPDPLPADRSEVYEAAVTVMMRVVFLLFAEERGLLPQGRLFAMGYGIAGELAKLDERDRDEGSQALDGTYLTWHRLLATSQALYRGASFEDLRLPSYGGSLFDPDRFPFLTARSQHGTLAITVSDRVMLEVLRSVQMAELKGQPARPISFRDIDVEQIGYIYEGLLGYSCAEVDEVTVGLMGKSGEEPELALADLEAIARQHRSDRARAQAIRTRVAETQPAAKPPTENALAKAIGAESEDAELVLRKVTPDPELRDRLRPFLGIIRRDLRERPLVVEPGGVLVVETPSRATAGAHYTPRSLAEEVVHHALEPLVFDPGPHDTPDQDAWQPISSDRILDLKVGDIACGSGAFLVAAARYLAARLVEAWHREGAATGTPHELHTRAIRTVVATCLYGADINAMAVEMCKLSLWLVSLDPRLPFSFVDDKVLHGNSLLGLTDVRQLERLHIDPNAATRQPSLFDLDVSGTLTRAARLRRQLATEVNDDDPQRSATTKRRQWRDYQELTAQLSDVADGVVAAGLRHGGKPGRALRESYANLRTVVADAYPVGGAQPNRAMLDSILQAGLTPTVHTDYERWRPLHWILAVPDVMQRGGFDAIIGNPPFRGGTFLTGDLGTAVRDWLVNVVAGGQRGKSDIIGYFVLRAFGLINNEGALGLIATKSVAQGETRKVGLDPIVSSGFTITRSIQSRRWPVSSVTLDYAAVWGTRRSVDPEAARIADGVLSYSISSVLEPEGTAVGHPERLSENLGVSFEGCKPYGMGFLVDEEEAREWIQYDAMNVEVLFPYLTGTDLNSRPDLRASRWVIDFFSRSLTEAQGFRLPYERVSSRVRPERGQVNRKALRERWWQHGEKRPAMRRAISSLDQVLVLTRVSKTLMPVRVPNSQLFSDRLTVFASTSFELQAILSSSIHVVWAIMRGTTRTGDPSYAPTAVFETFPRPRSVDALGQIGKTLESERRELMLRRSLSLTHLYDLINDPNIADSADPDVARLREIHVELDHAVMAAYRWDDVPLEHGFYIYRQMRRWTVSPTARVEILDRLLQLNHERAALQGEVPPSADTDDETEGAEE